MPRTTINLDESVLDDLKRLQRKDGKTLGELASELLATAIAQRKSGLPPVAKLEWISRPLGARIALDDKEALFASVDDFSFVTRSRSKL